MRHTPKIPREATPAWLTEGAVEQLAEHPDGPGTVFPVLQVADVQPAGSGNKGARRLRSERFRVLLSDGVHSQQSVLATGLNGLVKDGTLRAGSVVHLVESFCNTVENRRTFIVCKLDVLQSECPMFGTPKMYEMEISPEEQEPNLPATVAPMVVQAANNGGAHYDLTVDMSTNIQVVNMDGGAMVDLLGINPITDRAVITIRGKTWFMKIPYKGIRDLLRRLGLTCTLEV